MKMLLNDQMVERIMDSVLEKEKSNERFIQCSLSCDVVEKKANSPLEKDELALKIVFKDIHGICEPIEATLEPGSSFNVAELYSKWTLSP